MDVSTIEARRREVLEQIQAIRSMRPGSVSEQFVSKRSKDRKHERKLGPYYVWCRYTGDRYVSQRLRSPEEVAHVYRDVANHKRFLALCKEFEELTERLGELERQQAASEEAVKKGLKSRPSGRPR
jgi:hypothetical protein